MLQKQKADLRTLAKALWLVCGKRVITPDTAVLLALHFGTDVAFWLGLQFSWDLHQAKKLYYEKVKIVS